MDRKEVFDSFDDSKPTLAPAINDLKAKVSGLNPGMIDDYTKNGLVMTLDRALVSDGGGDIEDAFKLWKAVGGENQERHAYFAGLSEVSDSYGEKRKQNAIEAGQKYLIEQGKLRAAQEILDGSQGDD